MNVVMKLNIKIFEVGKVKKVASIAADLWNRIKFSITNSKN